MKTRFGAAVPWIAFGLLAIIVLISMRQVESAATLRLITLGGVLYGTARQALFIRSSAFRCLVFFLVFAALYDGARVVSWAFESSAYVVDVRPARLLLLPCIVIISMISLPSRLPGLGVRLAVVAALATGGLVAGVVAWTLRGYSLDVMAGALRFASGPIEILLVYVLAILVSESCSTKSGSRLGLASIGLGVLVICARMILND